MIMTIAAPIAVVEAFVPDRADRPWLGRTGLTVIGLLYLLGAGFVFAYDTRPRGFLIAPAQLIGTAVVSPPSSWPPWRSRAAPRAGPRPSGRRARGWPASPPWC
jgi:hypothetical protein